MYGGPDPSFPYSFQVESLESLLLREKSDGSEPRESQSSGSWHATSFPMPELNCPPSTDCGLSTLVINQFQAQSNGILEDFVKFRDWEDAQFLPEPDKNSPLEPMVQKKALHDISAQGPQPEGGEIQTSGFSRSISWPPPSTNRAFCARDTDTASLAKINALRSRPKVLKYRQILIAVHQ